MEDYQAKAFRNDIRMHLLKINLKTAFPKNFAPTLFTNFCVVIATLLITVKLDAKSVRSGEHLSLSALTGKRVNNSKKIGSQRSLFFLITWIHLKIF